MNDNLNGLTEDQLDRVNKWLEYFKEKYPLVGILKDFAVIN